MVVLACGNGGLAGAVEAPSCSCLPMPMQYISQAQDALSYIMHAISLQVTPGFPCQQGLIFSVLGRAGLGLQGSLLATAYLSSGVVGNPLG
jgi:hypothetical protein